MSEELKPCPFCGCKTINMNKNIDGHIFWFYCYGCGATGPRKLSRDDAETAWNRRVDDGNS